MMMAVYPIILVLIFSLFSISNCLSRDEIMEYLKYKQQTRSTFDGRIDSQVEPIGYVDNKPIWPRILEKVKSPARIFFDDDNFAYPTGESNLVDLIHKMDKAENYRRVLKFLEKYTS